MPKPVFIKPASPSPAKVKGPILFRRGTVVEADLFDEDEPPPQHSAFNLTHGTRQGAYTLACLPAFIHGHIKDPSLPLTGERISQWASCIEYHREKAALGLINFDWADTRPKPQPSGIRMPRLRE